MGGAENEARALARCGRAFAFSAARCGGLYDVPRQNKPDMTTVIKTNDGVSHDITKEYGHAFYLDTTCGLSFASWTYEGVRQGRKNRRRPMTQTPELGMGEVDCMVCLVRRA